MGTQTVTAREAAREQTKSISWDASAADAARLMISANVESLLVIRGGEVVGTVGEHDLVAEVLAKHRDPAATRVGDVCSAKS